MMECSGCGVRPGQWHRPGCECEICPYCGEPLADCGDEPPLDDRLPWSGMCPWLESCLRFGFFERPVGEAWVPCGAGDPGSVPDVPRLLRECFWFRRVCPANRVTAFMCGSQRSR